MSFLRAQDRGGSWRCQAYRGRRGGETDAAGGGRFGWKPGLPIPASPLPAHQPRGLHRPASDVHRDRSEKDPGGVQQRPGPRRGRRDRELRTVRFESTAGRFIGSPLGSSTRLPCCGQPAWFGASRLRPCVSWCCVAGSPFAGPQTGNCTGWTAEAIDQWATTILESMTENGSMSPTHDTLAQSIPD